MLFINKERQDGNWWGLTDINNNNLPIPTLLQSTTYNTTYNTTALTPTNIQYTWTPDRRRGTTKKKCSKYSFVNGFPALYYGRLDSRPLDS